MKAIDNLNVDYKISPYARYLKKHGMNSAALFYKNLNEDLMLRSGRAVRYLLETANVPKYREGQVVFVNDHYNLGNTLTEKSLCRVTLEGNCVVNVPEFERLQAETEQEIEIKKIIIGNSQHMYAMPTSFRFLHYGNHNVIDFEFLAHYGFKGYRERVLKAMDAAKTSDKKQFEQGLLEIIDGTIDYIERYKAELKSVPNPSAKLQRLINALEVVPINPATNFYEAYTTMYAGMFFSGCYEPGRIDHLLNPYYENDDTVTKEEAQFLIREMFLDLERRTSHPSATHVTIGGTKLDLSPDYNDITEVTIRAIGGIRTPNVSLRVRKDMPQNLWDAFLDNMSHGYAQPAIVNEHVYLEALQKEYNVPLEDAVHYAFGGCTEIMIQGNTCCDAIWVAYDILDIFEQCMYNNLSDCNSYEEFYKIFKDDVNATLKDMMHQTNIRQHALGVNGTEPFRTLMTGDGVETGLSYFNGGTRYNFDSTNIYGATNTINSLYTIKKFFAGEFGNLTKDDFLKVFANNYEGYEDIYKKCNDIPKLGNYNEEIDEITADLMGMVSKKVNSFRCFRGNGRYLPAIIPWIAWIVWGKKVGATPDGRVASQALADSAGAMQGTDLEGPTSLMAAALKIPQKEYAGTCVLNLRLDKHHFSNPEERMKVQQLLSSYFEENGTQIQINVVDKETLLDALAHPEKHRDLIVRVGGFSDNYIHLNEDIKKQILLRTEH